MDDKFCPPQGGGCEPQWAFGAWWILSVVGIALFVLYLRYRSQRLEHLAVGLGLSPNQLVVWRRGGPTRAGRWLVFGVVEVSLAIGAVVGVSADSFLMGFQAATIPLGVGVAAAMLYDLRWLRTLHPTADDIEPLDPNQ